MFHPNQQQRLITDQKFSPIDIFKNSLRSATPWSSIIEFATSDAYCHKRLYPRQATLLRLMYLETEQMTQYDLDVIEEWRKGFKKRKDIFGVQPDVWDRVEYLKSRGYRHFPHIQAVLGRRGSKGLIGAIAGAEQLAYFYSLDDWQAHYGIDPGQDGYLSVVATSQGQAQRYQFADIRRTVEKCRYLRSAISTSKEYYFSIRTPADVRNIAELKNAGVVVEREIATLRAIALSASSTSGRGAVGFANFFDEFAFMITGTGSAKSGEEIYEAWQPSLDQFGKDALTYIPSSPFTKIGKFFELYKQGSVLMDSYNEKHGLTFKRETEHSLGIDAEEEIEDLTSDPEMLVFQGPSWILYEDWERAPELIGVKWKRPVQPDLSSEIQRRRQRRNPTKFKVERMGQFAEVQDAYLDPDKVDEMYIDPPWRDPLEPQTFGHMNIPYRIHCDPSRTNANFALAIGHLEDAPPDEYGDVWPHVIFDFLKVWKPVDYPDHTIDYIQIEKEIDEILKRFPSTVKISFDQWNSARFLAHIRQEFSPQIRVTEEVYTEKINQARCEKFKSALNLGWIHSYLDHYGDDGQCLLEQEMKFLQEVPSGSGGMKVVKQDFGPCTTKDLFDAVSVVTTSLLHDALDRWAEKLAVGSFGSTDVAGLRSGREWDRMATVVGGANMEYRGGMGGVARDTLARFHTERLHSRARMDRQPGFPTRGRRQDAGQSKPYRPRRIF
jgi:hypothetical protein